MIDAYPLQWPPGWKRTQYPVSSQFKTSFARARDQLYRELELLGAKNVVISSNMMIRADGIPYAKQRIPEDRGVAVYFDLNGENQCIPCDKWYYVEDNLHAIELTVAALRGLERWGAKEMVNAAFRGFKALPAAIIVGEGTARAWYEVLEVQQTASPEVIKGAYQRLLHKYHPDKGGTNAQFIELQNAYKQGMEASNANS